MKVGDLVYLKAFKKMGIVLRIRDSGVASIQTEDTSVYYHVTDGEQVEVISESRGTKKTN